MIFTAVSYVFIGIALVLLLLFISLLIKGGGTKKYKVTLSNNLIYHVTRNWYDGFNDPKDMKVYRVGKGKITMGTHWIITVEEES